MNQATPQTQTPDHQIDLICEAVSFRTDSLADITDNIIQDSEHYLLPSDIFEKAILEAINDLIDDFERGLRCC